MLKRSISLLITLILLVSFSFAQITLTKEVNSPDIGDKYVMNSIDSVDTTGITYPPTEGSYQYWFYDSYPILNKLVNNQSDSFQTAVKKPSNTPHASEFPGADFSNRTAGFDTSGNVQPDSMANFSYNFYRDSFVVNMGVATPSASGAGTIINYDDNKELTYYPFTYQDSTRDEFSGRYYLELLGTVYDSVDIFGYTMLKGVGHGDLYLPFDTIRKTLLVKNVTVQTTVQLSTNDTSKSISEGYSWYIENFDHWVFHHEKSINLSASSNDTNYTINYVDPGKQPKQYVSGLVKAKSDTVTSGKVIAYQSSSSQAKYDVVDAGLIDNFGYYQVDVYQGRDLILYVIPDPDQFSGLMPTYLKRAELWSKATKLQIYADSTIDLFTRQKPSPTTGQGLISGKVVKGPDYAGSNKKGQRTQGDPLANVNCSVVETGQDSIYQITTTDDSGQFTFDNLPEGNYDVHAEVPGIPVDTSNLNDFDIASGGTEHKSIQLVVDSDKIYVDKQSGIQEPTEQPSFIEGFYPNPGEQATLHVNHEGAKPGSYQVQVRSISGKLIQEQEVTASPGKNKIPLRLNQAESGIYFVKVISPEGQTAVQKWVKY